MPTHPDHPYIVRTTDRADEHRATIKATNHEPLMVISEGIEDPRDIDTALLRTLEALLHDPDLDAEAKARIVSDWLTDG